MAPGARALALRAELQEIGFIQQDEHGHSRVPPVALPVAQAETLQGCLLPRLEAIKVGALCCHLCVIAGHHIHSHLRGPVQEAGVAAPRIETEGVVHAHGVAANGLHHPQIVTATRAPLLCVTDLQHVLGGQSPLLAGGLPLAWQGAIGDAAHRPQRRHLRGRGVGRHRRGARPVGRGGCSQGCCSSRGSRRRRGRMHGHSCGGRYRCGGCGWRSRGRWLGRRGWSHERQTGRPRRGAGLARGPRGSGGLGRPHVAVAATSAARRLQSGLRSGQHGRSGRDRHARGGPIQAPDFGDGQGERGGYVSGIPVGEGRTAS
mmetsp:Transcript_106625/g.318707  ORF Transcript_106625/g.318707 Transcript_106625/m.318707 type:complete len:317 (-) Transcript_106625:112-1062(-)